MANHPNFFGADQNNNGMVLNQEIQRSSNQLSHFNDNLQEFLQFKRQQMQETLSFHRDNFPQYNLQFSSFRMRFINWDQMKVKQQKLIHDHVIQMQTDVM